MGKKELIYFAGFFDGEGCITIASQGHKYNGKLQKYYRLEVACGSTNHWIIEMMKFQFGGAIYKDRRDNHPPTHRPFWRWMICSKQAMLFLEELLPYLKLKKAEAEIAIKWHNDKLDRRAGKRLIVDKEKENAVTEASRILLSRLKRQEVT